MDEINAVTSEQIEGLRNRFHEKVVSESPDFHPKDIERVKTDDLWLRRFIAHGEFNMDTSLTLLYDCCQWRKEFGTNDLDDTKLTPELLDKGTLFIRNKDKWGKKLLIFKAKTHQKGTIDMDLMQKFVVYYFERIERESNSDQISIIFDMKDTGWNNMDMDFVRYLITLLKTYYPYFVNYLIIYEMPWLLNAAWKIIKGWLPPKFVDRVKFQDRKNLKDYIDTDCQLSEWGGTDNYTFKFEPESKNAGQKGQKISNGGPAPELKGRKLQFAEVDHAIDNSQGKASPIPLSPQSRTNEADNCLADVQERLSFLPSDNEEYAAQLKIRNNSPNGDAIAVKIKTTSPDKYRVKPIVCVITKNAEATVNVSTHQGVSASTLTRDRFQIQVTTVPNDMMSSLQSNDAHDLGNVFKRILESGCSVETYRVAVSVEARSGDTGTPSISLNDDRLRRGLEDLERKIAESVSEKLAQHSAKLQKKCLMGIGLILLLFVVIFLYLSSLSRNYPVDCTKVCREIIEAGNWAGSLSTGGSKDSCRSS